MQNIECEIDGRPVAPELIGPPDLNYGQLHRWARFRRVAYAYRMPAPEFVARAARWFDQYRAELQADLAFEAPEPASAEEAFASLGFPPLAQLVAAHPDLARRIWLELPLELNMLFGAEDPARIRYVANSVDDIAIKDGVFAFTGIAFDRERRA